MEQQEIIDLLDIIEQAMINKETLGFSPEILAILDDMEASNDEIDRIKAQISETILMHLFNIANSAYYVTLRKGSIHSFCEVVNRLGMVHTKILIIVLALKILASGDKDIEVIFARSYASSVIGKIITQQFGITGDGVKKVELGGLFSEIGKMIMFLYKKMHAPEDVRIDEEFINKYQSYMAERIIERFSLPDYLKSMVFAECLVVEADYLTISGLTQLAISSVAASFNKFNNHLVIESVPLSLKEDQVVTLDSIIADQFNAVSLGKYLRIIKQRERILPKYEAKKEE